MAIVSITEAATLAGVSRGTLYNRLREGVVSRSGDGIDTAELLRVFGPLKAPERVQTAAEPSDVVNVNEHQGESAEAPARVADRPSTTSDAPMNALLDAHLAAAERERAWLRELIEVERARVTEQARELVERERQLAERDRQIVALTERVVALLPAPASERRRGFWQRVFG